MVKTPLPDPTPIDRVITWIGSVPSLLFHTILFTGFLLLTLWGPFPRDLVLLVWNTIVSLEAIYLAIFIQFSVNRNTKSLQEVEQDIDEIQEDVDEIQEDVKEFGEDLDEIQEDLEEISEDVEEISKDIDEIQEDVEELNEEEAEEDKRAASMRIQMRDEEQAKTLEALTADIRRILNDLEHLKKKK